MIADWKEDTEFDPEAIDQVLVDAEAYAASGPTSDLCNTGHDGNWSSPLAGLVERLNLRHAVLALVAVAALAACGGDDAARPTTAAAAQITVAPVTPAPEPAPTGSIPPSTAAPSTTPVPTSPPTTVDALTQALGLPPVDGSADPARPTFVWVAPVSATSYDLVVQSADGEPTWGGSGATTSIVLGVVVRDADREGPTLLGPSQVQDFAFAADGLLVGVSGWVQMPGG